MMFNVNTKLCISEDTLEWMAYHIKKDEWSIEKAINEAFKDELIDSFLAQIITNDIYEELKENYL